MVVGRGWYWCAATGLLRTATTDCPLTGHGRCSATAPASGATFSLTGVGKAVGCALLGPGVRIPDQQHACGSPEWSLSWPAVGWSRVYPGRGQGGVETSFRPPLLGAAC